MGRGGFWPAISNRFIGTRCRIHIAKWPLVQTDCSKPVRPCLLHPSLSLSLSSSLLFFSFRLHHGYDDTRVGSVVCFSRPTTYFSRQRGERKKKNEKGKRGKDRKSEILVAFHVQQEEEQLQRERETKGEGKGRKSELLVRVNNKNNYNNRETLSIEDSYRVKPILETSLSSIRLWNDESFSLSLSMTLGPLFMFGKVKGTKLCQPRILQVAVYTHHRNRNFGSVHVHAAISSRSIRLCYRSVYNLYNCISSK